MVGILVVSHSKQLAAGVLELAKEMASDQLAIAAVGGLEDGTIGTDAVRILAELENVYSPEGVLVFADLGSSVLSTQVAMDLLEDEEKKSHIHIVNAPIVEGTIIAAMQASIGDPLHRIVEDAQSAWKMEKA